jgi:inhibitor of cysteine peptidase
MLTLTRNDNNSQIAVTVGQELQIALSENPTTGFRWQVQASGKPVLEVVQEDFDSPVGGVGRGGTRRWRFKAVQEGSAGIDMAYRRPSDPDQSPAETFRLTVRAER